MPSTNPAAGLDISGSQSDHAFMPSMSETDAAEQALRALITARREGRPIYVIGGQITAARPVSGPYVIAWPNGQVTAIGLGRKRVRRKKTPAGSM